MNIRRERRERRKREEMAHGWPTRVREENWEKSEKSPSVALLGELAEGGASAGGIMAEDQPGT